MTGAGRVTGRRPARRALLLGVTAATAVGALAPSIASALDAPPALTAVAFRPIAPTEPVLGSDGRVHLAYELTVVNTSSLYVTIGRIDAIRPGGAGKPLASLSGKSLGALFRINAATSLGGTRLAPGGSGTIFMDATLPKGAKVPATLQHRITTIRAAKPGGPPPPGTARVARYTGVTVPVVRRPAVLVQPPLRGPRWVVANGCCDVYNAHRGATLSIDGTTYVAQRFAIDFVQLAPNFRLFNGPNVNSSYAYFGDPIYAAGPGRVVQARDGQPEQVPGELPSGQTVETADGNYLVIDIGGGRYTFYAHMQPGSLRVKVGDRVAAGQVIGLLGNTGNTDGAHLHFHVMDGPSPLTSNGLPFRFTSFTGQGIVADASTLQTGEVVPVDASVNAGPHTNALPLEMEVVDFGG